VRLNARTKFKTLERSPRGVETGRALAKRGSILAFQTVLAVSPIRKAVEADRLTRPTVITRSLTLFQIRFAKFSIPEQGLRRVVFHLDINIRIVWNEVPPVQFPLLLLPLTIHSPCFNALSSSCPPACKNLPSILQEIRLPYQLFSRRNSLFHIVELAKEEKSGMRTPLSQSWPK